MTSIETCDNCFVPSFIVIDGLCRDCVDLIASPFAPTRGPHGYVFSSSMPGICCRCGAQRENGVHTGHDQVASDLSTHYANLEERNK